MNKAVLFDLDGTLVDTAPDMGASLNILLQEKGRPQIPQQDIRSNIEYGGRTLLEYAFNHELDSTEMDNMLKRYLEIYEQHLHINSSLFPHVRNTLDTLSRNDITWGIVTNKPGYLSIPLIEELGIASQAACHVHGNSVAEKKPSPLPLWHAAKLINHDPVDCIYVGDSERDVQAAKAANMQTVIVTYGYEQSQDEQFWGADHVINNMLELLDLPALTMLRNSSTGIKSTIKVTYS